MTPDKDRLRQMETALYQVRVALGLPEGTTGLELAQEICRIKAGKLDIETKYTEQQRRVADALAFLKDLGSPL